MPAGRPPKPQKLKILNGNPGKRPLNAREPQPAAGAPSCPSWLDAEAKAEWRRVVRDLERAGLVAKVDRAVLAAYCVAWSQFVTASKTLAKEGQFIKVGGQVVETKDKPPELVGYQLQPHPAVSQQRSAWAAVRQFSALFGLDPSSRGKLHVPKEGDAKNLKARFFGAG